MLLKNYQWCFAEHLMAKSTWRWIVGAPSFFLSLRALSHLSFLLLLLLSNLALLLLLFLLPPPPHPKLQLTKNYRTRHIPSPLVMDMPNEMRWKNWSPTWLMSSLSIARLPGPCIRNCSFAFRVWQANGKWWQCHRLSQVARSLNLLSMHSMIADWCWPASLSAGARWRCDQLVSEAKESLET